MLNISNFSKKNTLTFDQAIHKKKVKNQFSPLSHYEKSADELDERRIERAY